MVIGTVGRELVISLLRLPKSPHQDLAIAGGIVGVHDQEMVVVVNSGWRWC